MNRNTGMVGAITLAVIAMFGFSSRPAGKGASPTTEPSRPSNNGVITQAPVQNLQAPCREIGLRISEFIADAAVTPPDSCRDDASQDVGKLPGAKWVPPLQPPKVHYIIATLPDPVHTHFSLLFDRLTEALQQAAQDQGYSYDGSWLPWNDDARTYGNLKDQQAADELQQRQDRQPGVLVFRKALYQSSEWKPCGPNGTQRCIPGPYSEGLIVFVVGENATGGVNREQFQNAVDWIRKLSPQGNWDDVRILGPYFSGSFPSLAQALLVSQLIAWSAPPFEATAVQNPADGGQGTQGSEKQDHEAMNPQTVSASTIASTANNVDAIGTSAAQAPKSLAIFSGSTSSKAGINWFTEFMKDSPGRFYSFQENDDVMIDRYCQYLDELGFDKGKLAVISETETAYGVIPSTLPKAAMKAPLGNTSPQAGDGGQSIWLPHCDKDAGHDPPELHGPLYLYYPRDIASLRSAYEQQSSGGAPSNSTGLGLPMDLGEHSSRQRDTIRNFGGKQTPLSQEATLFGITNLFKTHGIQFIVLRSSNPLDQVFLTRFLSRAYPQARVVLTGADLLFRRSSETAGFRGTLTLTTYPLLTRQQDWTYWQQPESPHSHRAFPEDFAEGLYLATRFLIDVKREDLHNAAGEWNHPLALQNSSVVIQDYALPYWLLPQKACAGTRPPTWLSVIGSEQLWPVSVLDDAKLPAETCGTAPPSSSPVSSTLPYIATGATYNPAGFSLPLTMFMCCVAILFWTCWHFFCCVFGSHASLVRLRWLTFSMPSSRSLAYFAPVPRWQHKVLIFIGCIIMGVVAILVASATGVLSAPLPSPFQRQVSLTVYCTILLILSWAALFSNYRALLHRKWRRDPALIGEDCSINQSQTKRKRHSTRRPYVSPVDELKHLKDKLKVYTNVRIRRMIYRTKRAIKTSKWTLTVIGKVKGALSKRNNKRIRRLAIIIRRTIRKTNSLDQRCSATTIDYFSIAVGSIIYLASWLILAWIFHRFLIGPLNPANSAFSLWRGVNLFTGVSPLVPLLLLAAGLYGWFWHSLSGLTLFNAGRSKLPPQNYLGQYPMCSREQGGRRIEHAGLPLGPNYGLCFVSFLVPYVLIWRLSGQSSAVVGLGSIQFGRFYFVWLSLLIVLALTETWMMLRTWARLRKLLLALDRLPLRRTLLALKAMSWGSVWKMSGNVIEQRERLLALQEESLVHLENEIEIFRGSFVRDAAKPSDRTAFLADNLEALGDRFKKCNKMRAAFDEWFARYTCDDRAERAKARHDSRKATKLNCANLQAIYDFQVELAETAGTVFQKILQPAWEKENRSQILDSSPSAAKAGPDKPAAASNEDVVMAAEEFFCLPYVGFIQNILGRIRSMTFSTTVLFVAATFSVACYPFDPRPLLGATFIAIFAVIAAVIIFVYAEMHRDPTLSYITNTNPGKLGADFWIKLIGFGIGPLVGLLTALFPEITGFLTSWLQPGVQAIK